MSDTLFIIAIPEESLFNSIMDGTVEGRIQNYYEALIQHIQKRFKIQNHEVMYHDDALERLTNVFNDTPALKSKSARLKTKDVASAFKTVFDRTFWEILCLLTGEDGNERLFAFVHEDFMIKDIIEASSYECTVVITLYINIEETPKMNVIFNIDESYESNRFVYKFGICMDKACTADDIIGNFDSEYKRVLEDMRQYMIDDGTDETGDNTDDTPTSTSSSSTSDDTSSSTTKCTSDPINTPTTFMSLKTDLGSTASAVANMHASSSTVAQSSSIHQSTSSDTHTISRSIKQQLLDSVSTEACTVSSQRKGVLGEDMIVSLLKSINSRFDVQKVSGASHVADIHVYDYDKHIMYVVECKFKQTITRSDVVKFESDVNGLKSDNADYHVIGLFLAITTDSIPGIGKYSITSDIIYLTEAFVNKDTLTVLFEMVDIDKTIKTSIKKPSSTPTTVRYEIPSNVLNLIVSLRSEYAHIVNERNTYNSILNNAQQTTASINNLFHRLILKEEFLKLIDNEFKAVLPNETVSVSVSGNEETRLREYIASHKSYTKKALLEEFPLLASRLKPMKKADIDSTYGKSKK